MSWWPSGFRVCLLELHNLFQPLRHFFERESFLVVWEAAQLSCERFFLQKEIWVFAASSKAFCSPVCRSLASPTPGRLLLAFSTIHRLLGVDRKVAPFQPISPSLCVLSRLVWRRGYQDFSLRCTMHRDWEKSRSQSSTFWHIWEKRGFHFLIRKLRVS